MYSIFSLSVTYHPSISNTFNFIMNNVYIGSALSKTSVEVDILFLVRCYDLKILEWVKKRNLV